MFPRALLLLFGLAAVASAQTSVTVTVPDTSGGVHTVTVPVTVTFGAPVESYTPPAVQAPASATTVDITASAAWKWEHDAATPGTSSGTSSYAAPTRTFGMTYTDHAGERWHASFATDTAATHFAYDALISLPNPAQVLNLELDMNQVLADGRTVIYGVQCASGSKTWEYTLLKGTGFGWVPSNLSCNPQSWTPGVYHHVQIAYHRDAAGVVTYDAVTLDGQYSAFAGASGADAKALGWSLGTLLVNVQMEGAGTSGTATANVQALKVSRW